MRETTGFPRGTQTSFSLVPGYKPGAKCYFYARYARRLEAENAISATHNTAPVNYADHDGSSYSRSSRNSCDAEGHCIFLLSFTSGDGT